MLSTLSIKMMKKLIVILVLFASANFADTVAYWRFDDGANGVENSTYSDSSGNGSVMSVNGATGTDDIPWATMFRKLSRQILLPQPMSQRLRLPEIILLRMAVSTLILLILIMDGQSK